MTYRIPDYVVGVRFVSGDALRAAQPPLAGPSLLRVSGIAGIAIAAFNVVYFGLQLVRGAL